MYGPPYAIMKKDFWDWLLQKVQLCSDAWAVMGDLNVIMDENEKLGGRPYQLREGNILKEFILNTGGVDLGFEGAPCPWQNTRSYSHHIRKQLDRAIADDQWCVSFPRVTVVHLPIYGSDHAPILLKVVGDNEKLLYPFQFLEAEEQIWDYFQSNFKKLYQSADPIFDGDFESLFSDQVTVEENEAICNILSEEEIRSVVFRMHPLKSPSSYMVSPARVLHL
ncbi:hypothetical protein CsatB_007378 [Cannabis sativa]|uniref:uncharacterized protein LOC115722809 n=1 Tax=Cannabis sativa TaxID=3483 RepID=UPI0011DFCA15|nr:uncharacterized protein LOC115722809 [Cannabis sativa]